MNQRAAPGAWGARGNGGKRRHRQPGFTHHKHAGLWGRAPLTAATSAHPLPTALLQRSQSPSSASLRPGSAFLPSLLDRCFSYWSPGAPEVFGTEQTERSWASAPGRAAAEETQRWAILAPKPGAFHRCTRSAACSDPARWRNEGLLHSEGVRAQRSHAGGDPGDFFFPSTTPQDSHFKRTHVKSNPIKTENWHKF